MVIQGVPQQIPIWWRLRRDDFPSDNIDGAETQVAVLGGGLAGVMTALFLAELGTTNVMLLEKGGLGEGASGRNQGHVNPGNIPIEGIVRQHGQDMVKTLLDFEYASVGLLEEVIERFNIQCGFRRTGYMFLAADDEQIRLLRERQALLVSIGHPPELWDARQCEVLGFSGFAGGLFKPEAGQVNPVRLLLGLARAAQDLGVQVRVRTNAYDVVPQNGGFVVRTGKGRVRAQIVVHATNRPHLLGGAATALRVGFLCIRGQIVAFPEQVAQEIGFGTFDGLVYGLRRCQELLLGGMRSVSPSREEGEEDDTVVNSAISMALQAYAQQMFGIPESLSHSHEWTGIMWESPDGFPFVGRVPLIGNQWVICGFGGHGLPGIPGAAHALAQMIVGQEAELPRLFAPRLDRFTRSV